MFKWLMKVLLNQDGIAPLVLGGMLAGGGAILGATLGKNKQKTIDPYAGLRGEYQNYLSKNLGRQTPFEYNSDFELPQPEVEKALESTVLGKLQSGSGAKMKNDIYDITQKYNLARRASAEEKNIADQDAQREQYNRLGLASSSPYLQDSSELRRMQGVDMNELTAGIEREGIDQEMKAIALSEDIMNNYMNQGQVLGQQQREYSKYPIAMSQADMERRLQEEMGFAGLTGNLIGSNPPQTYFEPNVWSQLGGGMTDIGSMLMMSEILGGGGAKAGTVGTTGKTQSQILGLDTRRFV